MGAYSKATRASRTERSAWLLNPDHEIPDFIARHQVIPTERWLVYKMQGVYCQQTL